MKPVGLIWDSVNYSCGYDATFTILGNLWAEDPVRWSAYFGSMSAHLGQLALAMNSVSEGRVTFEQARNAVRRGMHSLKPNDFPMGSRTTSIDKIATSILPSKYYGVGRQSCSSCGYLDAVSYGMLESYLSAGLSTNQNYPVGVPLQDWMSKYLSHGRRACPSCASIGRRVRLGMNVAIREVPPLMLFDLNHCKLVLDNELKFNVDGVVSALRLRGIIYGGQNHFTARFVRQDGSMWFHDGITTGRDCVGEVNINTLEDRLVLHKCGEKKAVAAVYARILH
ncbi:hypothetical protein C8R47DRAFT_1284520 [Mycena vitilis]|nr:hypothetical protein C8R47DRAFT_1284520 [Mycena vitilis]